PVLREPSPSACLTPFFEGCSPVPLLPSVASAAAVNLLVGDAATARARGERVVEGMTGVAAEAVEEAVGVAVEVGVVSGVGASVAAVWEVDAAAAVVEVAAAVVLVALREWYAGRGRSGGAGPCTYVLRTGGRRGETCALPHTAQRWFGCLTNAWRAQYPDAVELLRWGDLLRQNVAIFDLDFDAILAAMYALTDSAEGDCYLRVPPDPGIEAAALGASASAAPGTGEYVALGAGESALSVTAPTEALHTFTLDSGASRSFFRNSTTLTPLSRPVAVSLADPSRGPVLAHSSTVLPCPAAPSGLLSGLHLPSFSTNLVAATSQVFAAASRSSPASAPCLCRPLSHETLLWHHCLGHPSLPHLRDAATARERGERVVEGMTGVAAEAVEEAVGVAVEVGVVSGVGASVAAVWEVDAAAAVVEVAAAVVLVALREWYARRGRSGGAGPCTYVLRTGGRRGETCGLPHTAQRWFGCLTNAWRAQYPDAVELLRWGDLLRQNVAIFDLDFDAILAAMYALTDSAEGDCYLRVPPDPGIEAAALCASASAAPGTGEYVALGAGESALSVTAPTEALHTFTLDSGASRSFFCNSTTLTPLSGPVAVSLADPYGGVLECFIAYIV
ncbi:unnamed protein product, partial [Closterium sp. NIES-54]